MKTFKQLKEQLDIPAIGQTFSRDLMPQLDSGFLKYLKEKNIAFTKKTVNTTDLKSTQSEFDTMKILNLMSSDNNDTIFVSNDDYVLDGHHRWIADHNTDGKTEAYVIDLPILELYRVAKEYESMLKEEVTHKVFGPMMDAFVSFASDKLGIKSLPKINYKADEEQGEQPSFGGYNPSSNEIIICTKNRHPLDVFRTLAHELVHHKQNEDGRIKDVAKEGATGSSIEDEANSMAGRLMRWFGKSNPDKFALSHIVESKYINEGSLHKWFKSRSSDGKAGWVQIGGKYQGKPCARQPGQKSTPKCRSSDEASRMTDAEIKYAVRKKREEDPNQHMKKNAEEPTIVATYKRKKMNEEKDVKGKGSGKKDACYYKVKARYDVWPSAYASGALVKCRQKGADNWGKKSVDEEFDSLMEAKKTKAKAKKAVNPDRSVFGKALIAAQQMQYAEKRASKGKKGVARKDYAAHYAMQDPVALVKAHIAKHAKVEKKPEAVTPTTHAAPSEPPKPMRPAQVHAAPQPYTPPVPKSMHGGKHGEFDSFGHYISHIGNTGEKIDSRLAKRLIKKDKIKSLADAMSASHPGIKEYRLELTKNQEKESLATLREIQGGMIHKILKAVRLREENTPSDREWGTDSLARIYAEDTPGQTNKKDIPADLVYPRTFPYNPLFEGKKKFVRKKKLEEDGVLDTASGAVGLPVSDSIGAEFGVAKSPSLIGGLVGVSSPVSGMGPAGSLYPFGTYGISESVSNERFGKEAEDHKPKHFKQLRENWEAIGGRDMGTVQNGTDEKRMKPVDENVDKASMQCNKPRAQAHGSGETGKSHIVKACAGGKEKIIRFGQLGVKGSPKKEGESKAYSNRRKRFKARHAKNIAKGKKSAAYWANRVKW